jgi:hypothetical protein
MSKGVKKVVSIAAAIAIPFVAPMIASSAFLAGVAGTIGTTATTALAGAGLGAAKAAAFDEDVGRGALMGGIGGGITGFQAARAAQNLQAANAGLAMGPPSPALNYLSTQQAAANAAKGLAMGPPSPALNYLATQQAGANLAGTGGVTAAGLAAQAPATFTEALRQVPATVAAKFTDPKVLADMTLRAGGMLAGALAAGDGLSPEEKTLLAAQTEELRRAQTENVALFNQRLQQAQELAGESRYFDPEYFGLRSARQQQVAGAQAKQAGLRGLTSAQRTSEARRYDLDTARNTGTAFDTGFGTGVSGRLQTRQSGLSAMPGSFPTSDAGYSSLYSAYGNAATRRTQQAEDIGGLFDSITRPDPLDKDKRANPFA